MIFSGIDIIKKEMLLKLWQRFSEKVDTDYEITFEKSDCFKVKKVENKLLVNYQNDSQLYRSLTLAMELICDNKDDEIKEYSQFNSCGAMLDCSRAGVMNVEKVKEYMEYMALMGLNTLLLYMEDTYKVEGYEYFGYMRGSYSEKELKEIDEHGIKCGIEVIPCIQTLGHFEQYIKWGEGKKLADTTTVVKVGSDVVYKFLDKIIGTVSKCFTTKRIHIGMDEAWGMGTGNYLKENGYRNTIDIFSEHLSKVKEITDKYGLEPMMWSDMYFRMNSKYNKYYDDDIVIPPHVKDFIPDNITLVYWDYCHTNDDFYENMIEKHLKLSDNIAFAGGIWLWRGLIPDYEYTFKTTNSALRVCKEKGIKDAFATIWGDDGCETDQMFSLIGCALYGEHAYNKNFNYENLRKRVKLIFGVEVDDFTELSKVLHPLGPHSYEKSAKICIKQILYNDIMCGLLDGIMMDESLILTYNELYKKYDKLSKEESFYTLHFKYVAAICKAASTKTELTQKLYKGYESDKKILGEVKDILLPRFEKELTEVKDIHFTLWHSTFRPFGFEVVDGRYGIKLSRARSAILRLSDYLDGKISSLPELEEKRLPFDVLSAATNHNAIATTFFTKGY